MQSKNIKHRKDKKSNFFLINDLKSNWILWLNTFVFRSLVKTFDISMGTAAGLYQSFLGFAIILLVNYLVRRNHEEYALF